MGNVAEVSPVYAGPDFGAGHRDASDDAVMTTMLAVASGVTPEEQLAKWFRSFIR